MEPTTFAKSPSPDVDVVTLLEQALESARRGSIRALAIVVVNPAHHVEIAHAGDLSHARVHTLVGGLARASNTLLTLR